MNLIENVGMGCVSLTTLPFQATALRLLDMAYDEGISHFDTAPLYGNGYSEKIVGEFLKSKKNSVTVTTKFGLPASGGRQIPVWLALPLNYLQKKIKGTGESPVSLAKPSVVNYRKIDIGDIKPSFEKSIKNLQTGHIHYYLLHEALPTFLTEEAFEYLLTLKKNGDVGKIGIATSYAGIEQLVPRQYDLWDILQYENGLTYQSDELVNIYTQQTHFYHSVLKAANVGSNALANRSNITGKLLATAIRNNPGGKVLFGTSKIKNLKENLQSLRICNEMSIGELNNSIENGLH